MARPIVILALIGCGQPAAPVAKPAPTKPADASLADYVLATMRGYRDDMCRCADRGCLERVESSSKATMDEMSRRIAGGAVDDQTVKQLGDLGLAAVQCETKIARAPTADTIEGVIAMYTDFKDRMCSCKDKACADQVDADLTKTMTELAKRAGAHQPKPDEAMIKRMTNVGMTMMECKMKLVGP